MKDIQMYGVGLEAEGFIMDTTGKPMSRIEGVPASAWVLEQLKRAGFQEEDALNPPYFNDVAAMQRWMCAYSGVKDFVATNAKDEHALTCKIKRKPWIVEVRYPDAVDTESAMLRTVTTVESFLKQVYES